MSKEIFIGRETEITQFGKYVNSGRAEFVAVYGRRRVGKTFFIRNQLSGRIDFEVSGAYKEPLRVQLRNFAEVLSKLTSAKHTFKSWQEAFSALELYVDRLLAEGRERVVLFFDELPWFDTQRSGFVRALDYFWNHYCSAHREVMLVVCGSATSWMVNNLINDRGGLHNRVTHEMHMYPFTLRETEQYLRKVGIKWPRYIVTQLYMILGGIPFYLDMLDSDETYTENIDRMMFHSDAALKSEYQRLYDSLFGRNKIYMDVIALLAKHRDGLTRGEIVHALKYSVNGKLSQALVDLENCDFIRYYNVKSRTIKQNAGLYQLVDMFTIFHFSFLTRRTTSEHYWSEMWNTPKVSAWNGLAFERVCMSHIPQIKASLHIDSIHTEYFSWRKRQDKSDDAADKATKGAQIDLVIERADQMTHICEMKFTQDEFHLTQTEYDNLRHRMAAYRHETATRHGLLLTVITTEPPARSTYNTIIDKVVLLDDLFR